MTQDGDNVGVLVVAAYLQNCFDFLLDILLGVSRERPD